MYTTKQAVLSLYIIIQWISVQPSLATLEELPSLIVRGTYYQVGYNVGLKFQENIQSYYREHPSLRSVWLPWSRTPEGQKVIGQFLDVERSYFPQYITEMEGMAKGANVSFIEMFLANHYVEMGAIHTNESGAAAALNKDDSCTDVFVNRPENDCMILAHNEDNTPLIQNKAYLLMATITDQSGSSVLEQFTAYCYPGQLPGNAFGFNQDSLIITVNGLYPKLVMPTRVGRSFITRAMLVASNVQTAVSIAEKSSAYGLSVNLGVVPLRHRPLQLYNIEIAPNPTGPRSLISVREITYAVTAMNGLQHRPHWEQTGWSGNGSDFHVNMYRRLSVSQIASHVTSSIHRTARIQSFSPPTTTAEALQILGDTKDKHYPIYRRPQKTDNETTLATGVFDLFRCTLSVYVDNPKTSPGPLVTLPLPC